MTEINNLIRASGDHIWFYDEINAESVIAFNILLHEISIKHGMNTMNSVHEVSGPAPIWIHLNTPGGNVLDGLAMFDSIKRISGTIPIVIIIEGMSASMGAIIAQAATTRLIRENAYMLIHEIRTGGYGKISGVKENLKNSQELNKRLKGILRENSKIPKAELEYLFKKDLYLNAKKCKQFGLVDDII